MILQYSGMNKSTYGRHSIRYTGAVIWSKFNSNMKNSESISIFKKQVRKMDMEYLITDICKNYYLCNS